MNLVEQHIINRNHEFFNECDQLCYASKNLRNFALYEWMQQFTLHDNILGYVDLYNYAKGKVDYKQLPDKVSKGTLRQLQSEITAYFKASKEYGKNPDKFKGKPRPPKYKHKFKGRYVVTYEKGAINKANYNKTGKIKLSRTNIEIYTKVKFKDIRCARIIKRNEHAYCIEIIYDQELPEQSKDKFNVASIDFGLNNLMAVTIDNGSKPLIINGKPLKSINQCYNKRKAWYQSKLERDVYTTKKLSFLSNKRRNKISDYLHKSTNALINHLVLNDVSTLVVGRNKSMKQDINIGKRNNQNFVSIPFYKILSMLDYKCKLHGIELIEQEESYTSKCSFLDGEKIGFSKNYKGKRIKRGMFKSEQGVLINADVNASFNIMKKAVLNIDGYSMDKIEGLRHSNVAAVTPVLITPNWS